jgi:glycosyltransferase involved in cell wall biosynthesis
MNIVYVLELFYPNIGGVEKLFFDLANRNVEAGNKVKVITTRFNKDLRKYENINGIEIIRLNLKNRFLFTFFSYHTISRHINDADIVHTTSFNAALPAYYASKRKKKKCIITYHEVWVDLWKSLPGLSFWKKYLFKRFEKKILSLNFNYFIAPSEYTAAKLIKYGLPEEKVKMIYNGINYPKFAGKNNNVEKKYVYFGRAGISKGLEMLTKAAVPVNKKFGCILYIIIPAENHSYKKKLEKHISLNNAGNYIKIIESIPDNDKFYDFLRTFAFSVIPSVSEGFCFSAVESIALRIPVLTSGCGALSEVVSGKHITMKEYSVEELSFCLEKAFSGKWDYTPEKIFNSETTFSEYSKIYNELVNGN